MSLLVLVFVVGCLLGTGSSSQVSNDVQYNLWQSVVDRIHLDHVMQVEEIISDVQSCSMSGVTFQCCKRIGMKPFHNKVNVCIKLTYLKKDAGFHLMLTLNNKVVYNKAISLKNPPSLLCFKVGKVRLCLRFTDISIQKHKLSACLKIRIIGKDVKLGCFSVPLLAETEINEKSAAKLLYPILSHRLQDVLRMNKDDLPNSG
ncbi:uncharacterized protein LOC115218615 [Argonauta hians]